MYSALLGAILGLLFGSLIKCLADRSTTKESFFTRSHCDYCHKTLQIIDLIPILSYFLTHGKCRHCHRKLSPTLLIYEVIASIVFGLLFYQFQPINLILNFTILSIAPLLDLILKIFAIIVLSVCLITDLQTGLIPNRITYPAVVIALIFQVVTSGLKIVLLYYSLTLSVLGKYLLPPHSDYFYRHAIEIIIPFGENILAAICLGLFFFLLIIVTRGKGMGGGDFKLSIFIGLILGLLPSLTAMMIAFILGSVFGIGLILVGKKSFGQTIPFGPFMSIGAIAVIIYGPQIIDWYIRLGH